MMDKKNNLLELPRGWVWTRLGEIAEINPKFLENNLNDSMEVSFLPMKAVEERTGKVDLSHIRKVSEVKKGYTSFRDGDILFAKITPCMENGKIAVVNNLKNSIGFGSTEFHVIHLGNPIDKKLLLFFLLQDDYRKTAQRSMTGSAGQLRVPVYFIENTVFPLPPLQEQQRIVAKIEELFTGLDAGVEALKKAKAQLKRYRQSVLKHAFEGKLTEEWRKAHKNELEPASILLERIREERKRDAKDKGGRRVIARSESNEAISEIALPSARNDDLPKLPEGWVWTKLESISDPLGGFAFKSKDYTESGFQIVKIGNVKMGRLALTAKPTFIKQVNGEIKEKYLLKRNDILISLTGTRKKQDYGFVAIVKDESNLLLNQRVARLRFHPTLFVGFFLIALQGEHFRNQFFEDETGNVGQGNVGMDAIKKSFVPLPPLSEQRKIVEEVERLFSVTDEVEKTMEQGLKQAERLRQSILKRAFEGKLVPQDPSDEPASVLLERIRLQRQQTEKDIKPRREKTSG